jgi:hypothetical protein
MNGYVWVEFCVVQVWEVIEEDRTREEWAKIGITFASTPVLGEKFITSYQDDEGWVVRTLDGESYGLTEGWIRRHCQFLS